MKEMRYTDAELSLMRNVFNDSVVLKDLRKQFLGMEDNSEQFQAKDLLALIRKVFLPEISGDAPILQNGDLWMSLHLQEKDTLESIKIIKAREILIKYMTQELDILAGKRKTRAIKLDTLLNADDDEQRVINIYARNEIIAHIEQMLGNLKVLAEQTPEDLKKIMEQNSSK